MSWFGWGGSSEKKSHSNLETPNTPIDLSDRGGGVSFSIDDHASQENSPFSTPVLALDQIKSAGVPVTRQMTPYLQVICVLSHSKTSCILF